MSTEDVAAGYVPELVRYGKVCKSCWRSMLASVKRRRFSEIGK